MRMSCKSIVFLSLVVAVLAPAQQKEITRAQAEAQLQRYTPAQIDAKLRELGLTRVEAFAKARELGIPLEGYLFGVVPSDTVRVPSPLFRAEERAAMRARAEDTLIVQPPPVKIDSAEVIPGFAGRASAEGLTPFGYDIFNYPTSTFEPLVDIPTPPDYVVGPNDQIILTVWGETQLYYELTVNRDGYIVIPDVGRVLVQGLALERLRSKFLKRMTGVYSGLKRGAPDATAHLDVSLGKLRTIQVFILGDVNRPGGYRLSSMATAFTALYYAGGPSIRGTMRSIQVRRGNKVLPPIDYYDFALRGDKSSDARLQDGDVIFIEPVGRRVAVAGVVVRPAIYELKSEEKLGELIQLSGGLQFDAYYQRIHIERVIPFAERQKYQYNILDLDVNFQSVEEVLGTPFELVDGDIVTVLPVNVKRENMLTIDGPVYKPGQYALLPNMTVRDLINAADGIYPWTFVGRGTIVRTLPNQRKQVIPFNVARALEGDPSHNVELRNLDSLSLYADTTFFPQHTVEIVGAVRSPGTFTRFEGMTVADLLVLAGGLTEDAAFEAEISRVDTTEEQVVAQVTKVALDRNFWDVHNPNDYELEDFDKVFIRTDPKYSKPEWVKLTGEVRFPGNYSLRFRGERLASFIDRAGGLKENAYTPGARLIRRMNNAGLVPVDFERALKKPNSKANLELFPGDEIVVPENPNVVLLRGEVFVPSAALYKKGAGLNYYLKQAGGVTEDGDKGNINVTLPNGQKWKPRWFILADPDILAGSTVYVPKKVEKESKTLEYVREITGILASTVAIVVSIVVLSRQ